MVDLKKEAKVDQWYRESVDVLINGVKLYIAQNGIAAHLDGYRTQLSALNENALRLYDGCGGKADLTTMEDITHKVLKDLNLPQSEVPL